MNRLAKWIYSIGPHAPVTVIWSTITVGRQIRYFRQLIHHFHFPIPEKSVSAASLTSQINRSSIVFSCTFAAKAGIADFIQPSLGPLQPNLDDFMNGIPLQGNFRTTQAYGIYFICLKLNEFVWIKSILLRCGRLSKIYELCLIHRIDKFSSFITIGASAWGEYRRHDVPFWCVWFSINYAWVLRFVFHC